MLQRYTQSTYETCLACCLLQAVDRIRPLKITRKLELDCINHSLKFSKNDFAIGHLDFIAKQFNVHIRRMVDNGACYDDIRKIKSPAKIKTEVRKIDVNLVNQLLDKKPILYVDAYYLFKACHYPHFITVLGKRGNSYLLFDTWDGKEKLMERRTLAKAISSLRNHIRLCPQLLTVEKEQPAKNI